MFTSYNFITAQRLLIKPFERFMFIMNFLLFTSLSQILAYFIIDQPVCSLLYGQSQIQYGIVAGSIIGILSGVSQWFLIRRYVSDWKWIAVVGLNSIFMTTIQASLGVWKSSFSYSEGQFSVQGILIESAVSLLFLVGNAFIYGYLQWYILRPYINRARWWIFIPFIAVLVGGFTLSLEPLTRNFLTFNVDIIRLAILPMIQAMGFCILKKKAANEHLILQSPLALSPDVVDYRAVQRLEKILYENLSRRWKTDLSISTGQLTYLVGVSHSGHRMTYKPMDQVSTKNVDDTPLPELATDSSYTALDAEDSTRFAKFQVMFTPPGLVQVQSWRGVPLIWIGLVIYVGIAGTSVLCALFQIDVPPFFN